MSFDPNNWEDVCFALCMECEETDNIWIDPKAALVAKYIKLYPHFEEDLLDFAAACRTESEMHRRHPPPEPTQEQVDAAVERAMRAFRRALRNVRRREARKARSD
jgi:hypothetical protein